MAAKALTKAQIVTKLSENTGLSKREINDVLTAQSELAYKQAKVGYTIPGIGKLVVVNRKARKGRNPATGEPIDIPAKRVLKFRSRKRRKTRCNRTRNVRHNIVVRPARPSMPGRSFVLPEAGARNLTRPARPDRLSNR